VGTPLGKMPESPPTTDFDLLTASSSSDQSFMEQVAESTESESFIFPEDCVFHPNLNNYIMIVAFCTIFCLSVIGNSVVVLVILQASFSTQIQ
jgi:hypothetical protein